MAVIQLLHKTSLIWADRAVRHGMTRELVLSIVAVVTPLFSVPGKGDASSPEPHRRRRNECSSRGRHVFHRWRERLRISTVLSSMTHPHTLTGWARRQVSQLSLAPRHTVRRRARLQNPQTHIVTALPPLDGPWWAIRAMSSVDVGFSNFSISASASTLAPVNLDPNRPVRPVARLVCNALSNVSYCPNATLVLPLLLPASSTGALYRVFAGDDWVRAVKAGRPHTTAGTTSMAQEHWNCGGLGRFGCGCHGGRGCVFIVGGILPVLPRLGFINFVGD